MGQMIEKCARAAMADIKRQLDGQPIPGPADPFSWSAPATGQSIDMEQVAAAVIDALMEPTEAMVEAAIAPYRDKNSAEFTNIMREAVAGYFRAMLSKAKTE